MQLLGEEQCVYNIRLEAFLKNESTKIFPDNCLHYGWTEIRLRDMHMVNPSDEDSKFPNQDMVIAWEKMLVH